MVSQANFNSKDFYENLGVPKDADLAAIKKAYKKLSLKHHPDKNPNNKEQAEEIFKKISYAYQVLSDAQKRKDFDMYGRDFIENGGRTNGGGGGGGSGGGGGGMGGFQGHHFHSQAFNMHNADEIFRNFFGGKDPFANFFDDDDEFFGGGFGGHPFGGMGGMHGGMGGMHGGMGGGMGGGMAGGMAGGQRSKGGQKKNRDPFAGMGMGMGGGFGNNMFDDDDQDFFGGGFGGGGGGMNGMSMMSQGGGFGGGGGQQFQSFQSSSFGGMGGGMGMGESISQQTVIQNGQQKTITKKTRRDHTGQQTTEIIEEYQDPRTGQMVRNKYIENGQIEGGSSNMKQIGEGKKKRR